MTNKTQGSQIELLEVSKHGETKLGVQGYIGGQNLRDQDFKEKRNILK